MSGCRKPFRLCYKLDGGYRLYAGQMALLNSVNTLKLRAERVLTIETRERRGMAFCGIKNYFGKDKRKE